MSKVQLDEAAQASLKNARAEANGPNRWVVLGYKEGDLNTLVTVAEGEGGLSEAIEHFPPNDVRYTILRKDHKVEMAKTVKFVFIEWQPNGIPVKKRTPLQANRSTVHNLMKPFHVELQASEKADLDEKSIMDRIGLAAGTSVNIREGKAPISSSPPPAAASPDAPKKEIVEKRAPVRSTSGGSSGSRPAAAPLARGGGGGVTIVDEDNFKAELKKVRDDKNADVNWLLVKWEEKDKLAVLGSGGGGINDLLSKVEDTNVNFGILRVTEVMDQKSRTTKFVFVKWLPDGIRPMLKAAVNVKDSAVKAFFSPFHIDFTISKKDDISEQLIMDRVGAASGTKSNVVSAKPAVN